VNVERIVIDSSVALKWRLRGEEAEAEADALQDNFLAGRIRLLIPTLFDYEIVNTLKVAVVRGRISKAVAEQAIADYQAHGFERYDFLHLEDLAFQLAFQYQRSVYDAAYLALAQTEGVTFYTGDKRLFNAVSASLPWVKWIEAYC
jgi:predicted nucleic acid-binding protein